MLKNKRKDLILIAGLLIIAAIGFLITQNISKKPARQVEISVDGAVIDHLNLDKDQEYTIPGAYNGTNHLIIKDGQAYMSEASCPDKVCIHQGHIQDPGQLIVCLPNLVIVKVTE